MVINVLQSFKRRPCWIAVRAQGGRRVHTEKNSVRELSTDQRLFSSARPQPVDSAWEKDAAIPVTHLAPTLPIDRLPNAQWTPQNLVQGRRVKVHQPCELQYAGDYPIPITSKLEIRTPDMPTDGVWPAFRMLDEGGYLRNPNLEGEGTLQSLTLPKVQKQSSDLKAVRETLTKTYPAHQKSLLESALLQPSSFTDVQDSKNTLLRAHTLMVRLREMDNILLNAQRQGRISFYLTCTGEEAIMLGAASALDVGDPLLVQYREQGMLMWRGFTLDQFCNQCMGNDLDLGKGRQMPIHYGSRELNYHTVSSPLGTQLPQAVGAGYRLKLAGQPQVAVAVFGEGSTSTPDFHSALNMAATTKSPTIFICRNNGYAISTSTQEQYAGDGIVSRAPGYGVAGIRVDGNDIFAVHAAVSKAKEYAVSNNAPVLIECMTYRQGHHSTSDDSTQYRSTKEIEAMEPLDPLVRFQSFLEHHGVLSKDDMEHTKEEEYNAVMDALKKAEQRPQISVDSLFTDVYAEMTPNLKDQQAQLEQHMAKYPDRYT